MTAASATDARSTLEILGARASSLSSHDIDARGVQLIRVAIVDTLGVALAGADFAGLRIARASAVREEPNGSLVLGSSFRASALDAGMLNGIAAHALDYDDGNSIMGGHPSTLLVPAILALGEELNATAPDLLAGYAAGYEVLIRLSRGLNSEHYKRGWHPTSTIGVLGVTAAAARMLNLDAERCSTALGIAASMASGIKANFGTMVKALHVGHAIRDGLLCAKLAANGYSSNSRALDADQGFFNVYNGIGNYKSAAIIAELDGPIEVNRGFNAIKLFPCCASTHSAINAAIQIRDAADLSTSEVRKMTIMVDPNRMPHTNRPHFDDALSGKFSIQYVAARGLQDGRVSLEHFVGHAHRDPAILAIMERTEVVAGPSSWRPNSFDAEVFVETFSGKKFQAKAYRSPPAPGEAFTEPGQLWDKFADCASRALSTAHVAALTEKLRSFPEIGGVRSFMSLLDPAGPLTGSEPAA